MLKQLWPFLCQFKEKLFREILDPTVRGANAHLSTSSFTKVNVCQEPLRVNGLKVCTENVDKKQIIPHWFCRKKNVRLIWRSSNIFVDLI